MKTLLASAAVFVGVIILASSFFSFSAKVEAQTAGKWWYSSNPSSVSVDGNTGTMTAIWPGMAFICSQPSKTVTAPAQCFTVIVSQIVK